MGKLKAGGEVGLKENKKGSGKLKADANLGLESESLGELKKGSDYAFDKIKSGFKATRKSSNLYDKCESTLRRYLSIRHTGMKLFYITWNCVPPVFYLKDVV